MTIEDRARLLFAHLLALALGALPLLLGRRLGSLDVHRPSTLLFLLTGHVALALLPAAFILPRLGLASPEYLWACVVTSWGLLIGAGLGQIAAQGMNLNAVRLPAFSIPDRRELIASRTMILAAFGLLAVLTATTHSVPVLELISSEVAGSSVVELRRANASQGTFFNIARLYLMPLVAALIVLLWPHLRSMAWRILLLSGFAVALSFNAYTGRKTPVVTVLILALFAVQWGRDSARERPTVLARARRSPHRRILSTVLIAGALAYPVWIFTFKPFGAERSATQILTRGVIERLFVTPAANSASAFELYPDPIDGFTWFQDVPLVSDITGGDFINLSTQVAQNRFGVPTNSPPPSVGTFYAQGGFLVVALGSMLAGFIFLALEHALRRHGRPTALDRAAHLMLFYGGLRFSIGYFHAILLTEIIAPTILLAMGTALLRRGQPANSRSVGAR